MAAIYDMTTGDVICEGLPNGTLHGSGYWTACKLAAERGEPVNLEDEDGSQIVFVDGSTQFLDAEDEKDAPADLTSTYENYWNTVIGPQHSPDGAVAEFDFEPGDRLGIDEWLMEAEGMAFDQFPDGGCTWLAWRKFCNDHRDRAIDDLHAAANHSDSQ